MIYYVMERRCFRRHRSFREKRPPLPRRRGNAGQPRPRYARIVRDDSASSPFSAAAESAHNPASAVAAASTESPSAHAYAACPAASPSVESFGTGVALSCSFTLTPDPSSDLLRLSTGSPSLTTDVGVAAKQVDKGLEAWVGECRAIAETAIASDRVAHASASGRDAAQRQSFSSRLRLRLIGATCSKQPNEPLSVYLFALRVSHDSARVTNEAVSFAQLTTLEPSTSVSQSAATASIHGVATLFEYAQLLPNTVLSKHAAMLNQLCDKISPVVADLVRDLALGPQATSTVVEVVTDFVCTAEGFWRPDHVHRLATHISGARLLLLADDTQATATERKQRRLLVTLMRSIAVSKRVYMRDAWRSLAKDADFSAYSAIAPATASSTGSQSPVLSSSDSSSLQGSVPAATPPRAVRVPATPP